MHMKPSFVFTLILCLVTAGCAALNYPDKNAEDLQRSKASIAQLNEQVASLNKEITLLKSEVQKMKDAEAAPVSEEKGTVSEKEKVKEVDISKKDEVKKPAEESPAAEAKVTSIKDLKVKVLSGNGKLATARQFSKKLIAMGYRVEDIGNASRADYKANTIYFASNFKKEAQSLAARLGDKTVVKPLTWSSVYHIIVVAVP
ncbi:MAG TPA: LytR C-terminal domain-containing protein [Syntrophales bacterium]|nr:LytR C-terminal domain-containing protein [Syntrophales bacterium]